MKITKSAAALIPSLFALAGCAGIGDFTRGVVGLNESPPRTEPSRDRNSLIRAGETARTNLYNGIESLVANRGATPQQVFDLAEQYYHAGRLAMRSQCLGFMETLGTVDGQTTFGQDLANNFFDTATVVATVSQSPAMWATGLSATQNSFNSVSTSAERYLLLTESVGALRDRVITRMEDAEGNDTPRFDDYRDSEQPRPVTKAVALQLSRESIEAVQRYGAPCTEAGIRQIITEALSTNGIGQQAQRERQQSFLTSIRFLINAGVASGQPGYGLSDQDVKLLYLWSLSRGADTADDVQHVREQIERELPYLSTLKDDGRDRLSYFVQQLAGQRPQIARDIEQVRTQVLERHTAQASNTSSGEGAGQTPATPTPEHGG